ncbi:piggyBac transposable element-derived protein 4-like [Diretmus argenteus]
MYVDDDELDELIGEESDIDSDADDEIEDPSFVLENKRHDDQPGATVRTTLRGQKKRARSATPSSTQWGCGMGNETRPGPAQAQAAAAQPWKTSDDPDVAPELNRFMPRRPPGAQVNSHAAYSAKDLFMLYFSVDTMKTLCKNTNKYAALNQERGRKYKWADVDVEELSKFLGLLLYTSLVSLPSLQDYWKTKHILSVPFPGTVMSRDRFRAILSNIHLSDPEKDVENDAKKGTPHHDKLFRIKPLLDDIRDACKASYHPKKAPSVDERMVVTKAKTGMTQFMKDKPTRWGIKLFVLADAHNGYTIDFNVYYDKSHRPSSEHGLSYDAVMDLIKPAYLGTGYHIYVNNFYTSPKLFLDLSSMRFGACGTYREYRKGCPRERANALTKRSERGSVRWIREEPLLFVKWMDTREVSMCSTIHSVSAGDTVQRRVKGEDGRWTMKEIPCPTPIIAYNQNMGGVDLSDQLLQYYSTHRRNNRWYRTLFLHFLDIAVTNAYILHCDIRETQQTQHKTHKDFQTELVCQLCGVDSTGAPVNRRVDHIPVPIITPTEVTDPRAKSTSGRHQCHHCKQQGKRKDTKWKCKSCDVPLCLILDRNCFEEWHS